MHDANEPLIWAQSAMKVYAEDLEAWPPVATTWVPGRDYGGSSERRDE